MTEHDIECIVERKMDRLDRKYLAGEMSEYSYQLAVQELAQWADTMLQEQDTQETS